MAQIQQIGAASDRVMARLVAGLECEFGVHAGAGLRRHFLAAEEADFCWDARSEERWLGAYESADEEDALLDRVAICGRIDGQWFAATIIVDGDGNAHGLIGRREFGSRKGAYEALRRAR